jgi:hypothetical protein
MGFQVFDTRAARLSLGLSDIVTPNVYVKLVKTIDSVVMVLCDENGRELLNGHILEIGRDGRVHRLSGLCAIDGIRYERNMAIVDTRSGGHRPSELFNPRANNISEDQLGHGFSDEEPPPYDEEPLR